LCFCIAWICGNLLVHTLPTIPRGGLLAGVLCIGALLALRLRAWWVLGLVVSAFWTAHAARVALDARLPSELDGSDVRLSGWVDDFPERDARRVRVTLRVDDAELETLVGRRIRLNWYEPEFMPEPAQRLTVTARLREPHGLANPGGFDYERWLMLERIVATGYVRTMHGRAPRPVGFGPWLLELRAGLRRSISARQQHEPATALIRALAIGDRSGFSDADWAIFRRTGTSHLIAISGLHIGIVATCVLLLTTRIARVTNVQALDGSRALAGFAAFAAAFAYAALAGFSVSTIRAVIMFAAALVIVNMRRDVSTARGLALAALAILVIDPLASLGGSFWLSFGAVACLLLATAARSIRRRHPGWRLTLGRIICVQLAVTLMTMPASAILFNEVSLSALPANLLAIPLFSLVLVPCVLLCTLLELCGAAPGWAWDGAGWLATAMLSGIDWLASVPGSGIVVPSPTLPVATFSLAGVALAVWWHPGRTRLAGVLALAPVLWPAHQRLASGSLRLTVLDVGHGLASVIETRNHVLVYDAGPRFVTGFDAGEQILLPFLRDTGAPGMLIVSHPDTDHSGGAAALIEEFPDMAVVAGGDIGHAGVRRCVAGQQWTLDAVEFEIIHPDMQFVGSENDASCVLRISTRGGSALLAGDIERRGEDRLVAGGSIDVDVVVAPHHGSATSSTASFVAATTPQFTIASTGFRNRWNFPRPEVVGRWCSAGSQVLVTGEHGAVEVVLGDGPPAVTGLRGAQPRYWRRNGAPRCGESNSVTL